MTVRIQENDAVYILLMKSYYEMKNGQTEILPNVLSRKYNISMSKSITNITILLVSVVTLGSLLLYSRSLRGMLFENTLFYSSEALESLQFLSRIRLAISTFEKALNDIERAIQKLVRDKQLSTSLGQHYKLKVGELSSDLDFLLSSIDKINLEGKKQRGFEVVRTERKKLADICESLSIRVDALIRQYTESVIPAT